MVVGKTMTDSWDLVKTTYTKIQKKKMSWKMKLRTK